MPAHRLLAFLISIISLALAAPHGSLATAAETKPKLKVLVVAGGHPYSVKPFRAVFDGYSDMQCTFVEEKTGGEAFEDIADFHYDTIVLYNYMKKPSPKQCENFLKLLDRGTGLVIMHHAIYGYRPWPEFQKIVGVTRWLTGAKDNFDLTIHVEAPRHQITQGLKDFTIRDEVYQGHELAPNVNVLLTTNHPENMRAIAWVHTYRKAPVCYFQLGHGPAAYSNRGLTSFLVRAIHWTAGRLPAPVQHNNAK